MKTKAGWALAGLFTITATLLLPACKGQETQAVTVLAEHERFRAITHPSDALLPLPPGPDVDTQKVELGRRLFFEPRLSHDNSLSCASCHDLAHGGADNRPTATGIGKQLGPINTPTVFNAGLNIAQFWDGRADTLEAQAAGPVHNPLEMGSNWQEVKTKLAQDPAYVQAFMQVYGQSLEGALVADALAAFERTLATPNSRFDQFLRGNSTALSTQEKAGYQFFKDYGCASCHQGAGIGGNMYQRFGVMEDYYRDKPAKPADLGRFNVTQLPQDRHVFKVPGLRNVAVTAPYFHDASAATLEEAVRVMGRYQLGRELPRNEVAAITAFLRALTGEWQGKPLQRP
ncbi:cytochrome B6 [Rhodoferax lacus]|uniref:Cytochrome B6 n=1 Tax=Rhodoferax lacus TaxID=2184758 RepID=A0A3E1RBV2_9BURK|nr:cytochrome-c peroxidase [Rhodoferax lacus]RFO96701.1 cytochrome B6 [Rhodoferax lacus]